MATDQEELDLSNSHANIDFSLIEVFGHCNFKGCNLKNIEKVNDRISPKYLDTDIFLKNNFYPVIFPNGSKKNGTMVIYQSKM